jgi:hypothetical protein
MDRQRTAVARRTEAIMNETGVSWNRAWRQAEGELGPATPVDPRYADRRRSDMKWPYFMLGAAGIFIPIALFVLLFLALITVGYGTGTSDGLNTFVNVLGVTMLLLWLMVPVSLAAIAMRLARSTRGVVGAWLGVAAWFAFSIWTVASTLSNT